MEYVFLNTASADASFAIGVWVIASVVALIFFNGIRKEK